MTDPVTSVSGVLFPGYVPMLYWTETTAEAARAQGHMGMPKASHKGRGVMRGKNDGVLK